MAYWWRRSTLDDDVAATAGTKRDAETHVQVHAVQARGVQAGVLPHLCGTDTVGKLSPFTHETRRLSDGHVEGVDAVRHRDDAVDAG